MSAESENKEKPEEKDENRSENQSRRYYFRDWAGRKSTRPKFDLRFPENPAVKQEDRMGCAVACVAFILRINYQESLGLFANGHKKADATGFYCKDIVLALKQANQKFEYEYVGDRIIEADEYRLNTIVFLERSSSYPNGHYMVRTDKDLWKWMDPWKNFPDEEREGGYRAALPEKPIYVIFPI